MARGPEAIVQLDIGEPVKAHVEAEIAKAQAEFERLRQERDEEQQWRQETVRELQAALEVVQAAQCWARERRLPATAAERWLMDMLEQYREYRTRYDQTQSGDG